MGKIEGYNSMAALGAAISRGQETRRDQELGDEVPRAVIMVIDLNAPKQSVNPLELLFAQMATAAQQQREESEENNHDRTEDAEN